MMEKLGIPQTHLSLKEMIKQVDEDQDGKISFREVKSIRKRIWLLKEKNKTVFVFFLVSLDFSKSSFDIGRTRKWKIIDCFGHSSTLFDVSWNRCG